MKNKILILSALLTILTTQIVTADTIVYENKYTYSPSRPGIEYVLNTPGLDFVSFNNFYNNPNIATESFGKCPNGDSVAECAARFGISQTEVSYEGGDERLFTIAKRCPNGVCQTGTDNLQNVYNNNIPEYLKEGDKVRFSIYFHNNAKDNLVAENLQIGIDLNNITDPTTSQVIRPRGYITADNNTYYDRNGNRLNTKMATDNTNMVLDSSDLYLETVYNSGQIWMNVDGVPYDDAVTIEREKTLSIEGTNVTITPLNTSTKNISIKFDKLHGCFKYSGFAFFDAVVKKRAEVPVCTEMKLTTPVPTVQINGQTAYKLETKLIFSNNKIPSGHALNLLSDDPSAKLYDLSDDNQYINIPPTNASATGKSFKYTTNELNNTLYYVGTKEITITDIPPTNQKDCFVTFTPPATPDEPICKELLVNHNYPIEAGTVSTLNSKALNTNNAPFGEKITYKVDEGYGFFMLNECEGLKENPNNVSTEFPLSKSSATNPKIFNTKKLQANSFLALSTDQKLNLLNTQKLSLPAPLKTKLLLEGDLKVQTKQSFVIDKLKETTIKDKLENFNLIQARCEGVTEITVDAETPVYFYATKDSENKNVVHITTNNTTVDDCERHFPIGPAPVIPDMPVCTDLSLANTAAVINGQPGLKLTPTHTFTPRFARGTDTLPEVYTMWTTTDGLGKFYTKTGNTFTEQGNSYKQIADIITITSQGKAYIFPEVYYVGENPLTKTVTIEAKTYDSKNSLFVPCVQRLTLNPSPEIPVCLDLETYDYFDTENPSVLRSLEAGKVYILTDDTRYSSAIENARTTYSSSEGAFLAIPKVAKNPNLPPNILTNTLLINTYKQIGQDLIESGFTEQVAASANMRESITVSSGQYVLFITYEDAAETTNALTVRATDRNETECIKSYPLTKDLVCIELEVIDWNIPTYPVDLRSPLKENSLYELSSIITMSKPAVNTQTTYSSTQGVFLVVPLSNPLYPSIARDTVMANTYRQIASDLMESGISRNETGNLPRTVTVNSYQTVFFITFVDATTTQNALTVSYAPGGFEACENVYSLEATPEIKECIELEIVRPQGEWEYDDFTDDMEQEFKVRVTTNPEDYKDEIEYRWTVRPSDAGSWSRGETTEELENILRDIEEEEEPRVTVQAYDKNTNEDLPYCRATLTYDYEEVPPEIEKFVYDVKGEDFKNLINIGGKATDEQASWLSRWLDEDFQYVNYLIEFTPGSAKSAEIYEEYMDDGAIEGSLNGELDYLEMAILVEPKGSADPYVIYVSEGFDEDRYLNERIGEEKIDDYENYGDDPQDFEDEYFCEDASDNVVCIANDFDDIEEDFKNGEKITLGNLHKAEKIYIIVQTENNTVIDDDRCKELTTTEGCGEEFDNTIHFNGSRRPLDEDFNLDDEEYDGEDSAKVIVLCPYIITRQGGDVFFRDVIDTGVDVNYCSEVKGGDVIVVEKPDRPTTPSTGAGDEETIIYKLPTHDVCKLSNTEEAELEEYRNVLKNFSSSVCEMQAEVSELWKEENVNKAIKANIDKISRFGKISGNINLNSQNDIALKGFGNTSSGVFVIENGSLTIGDSVNPYNISRTNSLPAYQTYIVINGDINIKSNVLYDDSGVNPAEPKSFPSAAFIAINGNINIANNVSQINGILMASSTEEGKGQIKSLEGRPTFDTLLTVNGSLIGDVYDIFLNRRAIGDPLKDQGSITVRYDQRVLLNTPEGLNQLIDVTQLKTAD